MDHLINRFEFGSKVLLYAFAVLFPLWFIPLPLGIEFGREVTFSILIATAVIFWLLGFLTKGKIEYRYSPMLIAGVIMLITFSISTLLSKSTLFSLLFADPAAEKLLTILLGFALMAVTSTMLRARGDLGTFLLLLFFSGAISGLISLVQFLSGVSVYHYIASFVQGVNFNVIGTVNGLVATYAMLFMIGIGLLVTAVYHEWKIWVRVAIGLSLVVFLADILLVNYKNVWIILLGSGIFLFGLVFNRIRLSHGTAKREISDWRYWLAIGLVLFSVTMLLLPAISLRQLSFSTEVSPSLPTTLHIVKSVFQEGARSLLFGTGPGTFSLDWARYKDLSVNQTIFWQVRFGQGFSWATTILATVGLVGFAAFLLFVGTAILLFLGYLLSRQDGGFGTSAFLGLVAIIILMFIYPANFSHILLLFLFVGILNAACLHTNEEQPEILNRKWLKIADYTIGFESPWTVFLSSLLIIFLLSLGVAAIYFEVGRYRVALAQQAGIEALNRGDGKQALKYFESAASLDPNNYQTFQALAQVRTEELRGIIQRASRGERVEQEFQSTIAAANQNIQRALELFGAEPGVWRTRGALYELITPFIAGADTIALESYEKAAALDPQNPNVWLDLGRTHLIRADRIQLLINQAGGGDQRELAQARVGALQDAQKEFQKSIAMKVDFAQPHFLLAQTLIRLGNIQSAIRSVENAKTLAPLDIGVAFQLGLLYYQNNDLEKAKGEFLRALSYNENYSNARYFLGLIYDRQGNRSDALGEFQKILSLNPDNQEVQKILENLRAKRPALTGVLQSGVAPEKRKEAPLK